MDMMGTGLQQAGLCPGVKGGGVAGLGHPWGQSLLDAEMLVLT